MLYRDRLLGALEACASAFDAYDAALTGRLEALVAALDALSEADAASLGAALATFDAPGALPTEEWDRGARIPFGLSWNDHSAARAWAFNKLAGRPTFAADGSQIEPDRRFSLPVALVQVGWFENLHAAEAPGYRKDVDVRVLGPDDLKEDEVGPPKRKVDLARFELEVAALRRYLAAPGEPGRIVYLDGSLVVSFAEKRKQDAYSLRYVELVRGLLADAEAARVPLIAYVDTSYAHDLATMLASWRGLSGTGGVSDAALLAGRLEWGDRTPTAICAREGILDNYGDWARRIGFCYLQTNADAPPARLEYPLWIQEAGLLDEVLDVVRADAIAGGGYPYTLAAADATAVLSAADRDGFYRTVQEFLDVRGVPLRFSKKALSKLRRR
ncbi:DNA double-strand break repair nuclease NurA [bacterium]|nr:DNA double-strand break repair nuclease NurA [bacterium]